MLMLVNQLRRLVTTQVDCLKKMKQLSLEEWGGISLTIENGVVFLPTANIKRGTAVQIGPK